MDEEVQIKPVPIAHDSCGADYSTDFDGKIDTGFFYLSIEHFMEIQEALLLQQLQRIARCPLGRRLFGKNIPHCTYSTLPIEFAIIIIRPFSNFCRHCERSEAILWLS